jgi:hypothetical protein
MWKMRIELLYVGRIQHVVYSGHWLYTCLHLVQITVLIYMFGEYHYQQFYYLFKPNLMLTWIYNLKGCIK